jgi:hypothetical protein
MLRLIASISGRFEEVETFGRVEQVTYVAKGIRYFIEGSCRAFSQQGFQF